MKKGQFWLLISILIAIQATTSEHLVVKLLDLVAISVAGINLFINRKDI